MTTDLAPRAKAQALTTPLTRRFGAWAVVTGASDGIGRAIAEELAAAGFQLVLSARREKELAALAAELLAAHGTETRIVCLDFAAAGAAAELDERTRDLDVGVVVLAAGFGTSGPFHEARLDAELEMIDVNCRAVAEATHAFARRLVARRRGALVLFSSLVAFQGVPRAANYAATKAWVQSFAEGIRAELAPHGVSVLASAPGPVRSGFGARAAMTMGLADTPRAAARGTVAALGRAGTVRPGLVGKLLSWSLAALPRWGRVRVMALVMRGMTRHADGAAGRALGTG